mgnify:CR=1 FL=1
MSDALKVGAKTFASRLILGTGKYASFDLMAETFEASGTEMVTLAIRRVDLNDTSGKSLLDYIDRDKYELLPNTAVDISQVRKIFQKLPLNIVRE